MKTRNGFVSNSSSSSFIIAFPNKPKDVSETFRILFREDIIKHQNDEIKYLDCDDYKTTKGEIANTVHNDIVYGQRGRLNNTQNLEEVIYSGYMPMTRDNDFPELSLMYNYLNEQQKKTYKKMDEANTKYWESLYAKRRNKKAEHKLLDELYDLQKEVAKMIADNFREQNKDKHIVVLEYGDRYRENVLECCGIFSHLPLIICSNH